MNNFTMILILLSAVQHMIILFLFSMIMKAGADYGLRSLLLSSDFIGY